MIHHYKSMGHISTAIDHFIGVCVAENKPIKMCFNGTVATVNVGDSRSDVYEKWSLLRDDYQTYKDPNHPALCTDCK